MQVTIEKRGSTWYLSRVGCISNRWAMARDEPISDIDVSLLRGRDAQYADVLNELEEIYVKRICP